MQVQPPGTQFGMPSIKETIGPVKFDALCFAVWAWISETCR